ncbi:MAG: tRNA (cytidine(34)-2'-O)-methyltransferase [Bacteroidia bacterium]
MFHIVLLEPRMPGNVGTIGRLAVATNCTLHLIRPYGFKAIDEEKVKRAGMDYWAKLNYVEYDDLDDFWTHHPPTDRHFFTSKKSKDSYFDKSYKPGDYFYFGREDVGLPSELTDRFSKNCVSIPMSPETRSLNVANAASIVAYEAWRQNI